MPCRSECAGHCVERTVPPSMSYSAVSSLILSLNPRPAMAECNICFNELSKLKVLSCGHCYCETCVAEMIAKLAKHETGVMEKCAQASATGENKAEEEEEETSTLTCPECRQLTTIGPDGIRDLKSKFVGSFSCNSCSELKSTDEFRWCLNCNALVCSNCFISQHFDRLEDGNTSLHQATEWGAHSAVEFCIAQLKLKRSNALKAMENTETYLNSYLEGLREYLSRDIRQKCAPTNTELEAVINSLSQEFQIDIKKIGSASEENRSFETILSGLGRMMRKENDLRLPLEAKVNVHSIPYPLMTKHLLSNEKVPFHPQWFNTAQFCRKSQESLLIGGNLIRSPSDICSMTNDILLVTDSDIGVFMFKNRCLLQGPVPLKLKHVTQFSKLCTVADIEGKPTAMMNTRGPSSSWAFMLLQLEANGELRCVSRKGSSHWSLPNNENVTTMASARYVCALSSKSLSRFMGVDGPEMWKCVYTPSSSNPHNLRLGSVIDKPHSTEILIMNITWQCFDIISVNHDDVVWGVRRIEYPVPLERPFLVACPEHTSSEFLLGDKAGGVMYLWIDKKPKECTKIVEWKHKNALKIVLQWGTMFAVMQLRGRSNQRCLEMIQM